MATKKTQKKRAPAKRTQKIPDAVEVAARLEILLSGDALTHEQREILTDALLELSNETQIAAYDAPLARYFYMAASKHRSRRAARERKEIVEILRLIEQGEQFDGYESSAGLDRWRAGGHAKAHAATAPAIDTADDSRSALLAHLHASALRPEIHGLAHIELCSDELQSYGICKGDTVRVMPDGDVENGEMAAITYWSGEDERRYTNVGFLFIESDARMCFRKESYLECDDCHFAPDELTIIGRVVRVEREGLPVKVSCELRALPFAEMVESREAQSNA